MELRKTKDNREYFIVAQNDPSITYAKCTKFTAYKAEYLQNPNKAELDYIIGSAYYFIYEKRPTQANLRYISVCDADYLGQGVGFELIKSLEEDAKAKGINSVVGNFVPFGIGATYSIKFYERNGYKITGFDNDDWEIFKDLCPIKKFVTQEKRQEIKKIVEENVLTDVNNKYEKEVQK